MRWLYSTLFTLGLPLILARLWWRGRKLPAYRQRWGERLGLASTQGWNAPFDPKRKTIWLHGVSVGETIAATPIIEALLADNLYNLVVTTTTPTGSERLLAKFSGRVIHTYNPYDLAIFIQPFLRRFRPSLFIIMETELWPNTLALCAQAGIPSLLANGRLSARSARGYQRFSGLSRWMMANLNLVAAQNAVDGQRFIDLGLAPAKLHITGNIKFDIALSEELVARAAAFKSGLGQRPVIIAGSTHPGEESQILQAFAEVRTRFPTALLILVPRHPDRFTTVAELCISHGFTLVKRSQHLAPSATDAILLGDTMGELHLLYGVANIAFIGNSLNGGGGHNLLEAAIWGVPLVSGPGFFNFKQIAEDLLATEGLLIAHTPQELTECWLNLLANPTYGRERGKQAQAYVERNRGALTTLLGLIKSELC